MHGIKVLMAKNYIDNLSEEVRKGMLEKAEQGQYPSKAPLGYKNNTLTHVIAIDPETAPLVQCTDFKGKCGQGYMREDGLAIKFADVVKAIRLDDETLTWIVVALKASQKDE